MVSFLDPNVIAYLATLFLAIPLLLFILRKILKNVPKNEFVALYGSILFWANFIYFVCEFVIWRPWFAWYLPIPFIPLLFCCSCCLFSVATRRPERLTVDEYQNLYEKIKATGPTLLTGKMIQTSETIVPLEHNLAAKANGSKWVRTNRRNPRHLHSVKSVVSMPVIAKTLDPK